jgi:hypothetical protein
LLKETIMPLTPDEAIDRNRGKKNLQFERAVRDLTVEVEKAIDDYTGEPVYVGLPAYLLYRAHVDSANRGSMITLEAADREMDRRFGPAGWNASIVMNQTQGCYWLKLKDARRS